MVSDSKREPPSRPLWEKLLTAARYTWWNGEQGGEGSGRGGVGGQWGRGHEVRGDGKILVKLSFVFLFMPL